MWSDKVMESHMTEKKDYIKEDYRISTQEEWEAFAKKREESLKEASDKEIISALAVIAKKHGTDYSDRTPDHYNVCRRGRWREWNPLENDVDTYELMINCGVYWLDIRRPLKELCEEIIMYRGEKNV